MKAKTEGVETHLVVLTDGAFGGEREDLVKVREEEVNRAAQLLGIKSLHCWSEPDRGLDHNESLVGKITDTIRTLAPAVVFFPGPFEIHPDHRATAFLVWAALQQLPGNGAAPEAIAYEIGVQNPVNLLIDVTEQYAGKKEAMAIYASQNSENNYQELVLALDKGRTFSLPAQVEFAEGFFQFQSKDMALSLQEVTHRIVDLYQ